MNKKDAYAILGLLLTNSDYYSHDIKVPDFSTDRWCLINVLDYLKSLDLGYIFVKDILEGFYYCFYHKTIGYNSEPLPKEYNKKEGK